MTAAAALLIAFVASASPGAGQPLPVVDVDVSSYPAVTVEVIVPQRFSSLGVDSGSFAVEGGEIADVAPVDAGDIAVGLVIDDRADIPAGTVVIEQGGAVELVRNARQGVRIGLRTPSGLMSSLTEDQGANIARIAGIIAGAPAVTGLADLIMGAIDDVAASRANDRHVIVELGAPFELDPQARQAIGDELVRTGRDCTSSWPGRPRPMGCRSWRKSRGRAPGGEIVAAIDDVTAAISNRYRVTLDVDAPGDKQLTFSAGDQQYVGEFAVPDDAVPATEPPATVPATVPATAPDVAVTGVEATSPPATAAAGGAPPPTAGTVAASDDDEATSPVTTVAEEDAMDRAERHPADARPHRCDRRRGRARRDPDPPPEPRRAGAAAPGSEPGDRRRDCTPEW